MPTAEHSQSCVHIRWMIRRDMPSVLAIEEASFEFPWSEEEFIRYLRQRNCISMVAEHDSEVVGFMIYRVHSKHIELLNLAVAPCARRSQVGTALVQKIYSKLTPERRFRLLLCVRETNLAAQLFFKSLGMRATGTILRDYYEDTLEDAYQMQYSVFQAMKREETIGLS